MINLLILILSLFSTNIYAHKASDSYLTLDFSNKNYSGQWDISLRDLEFAIGLDQNGDGKLSWGEIKNKHEDINRYAVSKLTISTNNIDCPISVNNNLLNKHTDGTYTVLQFTINCSEKIVDAHINYRLFFDVDKQHRGLLKIIGKQGDQSFVFSPASQNKSISTNEYSRWSQLADYTLEGIGHILIGFDHILFLISLLLPTVLILKNAHWIASTSLKNSFIDVVKIVTAFTVAHSITLGLASLNFIYLPSRLVESVIAASVIFAAANNINPFINLQRWKIAFSFGLIHGFGFASVLQDLDITSNNLVYSLVGFNIGVELGQLLIVSIFLPIAFLVRKHGFYKKFVLQYGSFSIIVISSIWLLERSLDIEILSFI